MNILIDICHPAHVHLLRNFIQIMKSRGDYVYVAVRNIPAAKELLELYNIRYIEYGTKSDYLVGKLINQIKYDYSLLEIIKDLNIDIGIGTSITIAHSSKISKMVSFVMDDDDSKVEPLFAKFAHPFANYLLSPDVLKYERNKINHIIYPGYHELAYLHPNKFTPDKSILEKINIREGEKYFVLRFNAFKAHHDIGVKGLEKKQKLQLINFLKPHGKIFITTEGNIDNEFEEYKIKLNPTEIFSLLKYATLFIGDSQTMTNESAVLGTPALRLNSFVGRISYLKEQEERFKLAYGFLPDKFNEMIKTIEILLQNENLKEDWEQKRQNMLKSKIDVTEFLVELISKYPESIKDIRNCSDYFEKFR